MSLPQTLEGRSRTCALDWCLPEMRESWGEENYVLLYPRQGLRSPQSASQTPQQESLLTITPFQKRRGVVVCELREALL